MTELSSVEGIKEQSDFLRGTLLEDLGNSEPNISAESEQLIKFHGIYAQDQRDVRRERKLAGEALEYIFMTRVVIPGGRLTASQWLALDEVAESVADGTIRLTTRQAVQFHGTYKGDLQELARIVDRVHLTSFAGCGDVVRNVVCCPSYSISGSPVAAVARDIATYFRPATEAHWEIFVDGKKAVSREATAEHDFYGATYLPRKFKIAIAHPDENCVDAFAQDIGLVPVLNDGAIDAFDVIVGGGLGKNYAHEGTFARLGDVFGRVAPHELNDLIAAIVDAYRELGNRSDRKRARLKYVIHDLGFDAFKAEVLSRFDGDLGPTPLSSLWSRRDNHLGWTQHSDGHWSYGLRVAAGRIKDSEDSRVRTALRTLAESLGASFVLTAQQDIVIDGIADDEKRLVEALLLSHGVIGDRDLTGIERSFLACVALPTCGQALAESERVMPDVVGQLVAVTTRHGRRDDELVVRLTGCPNGCARPAVAEIGIVGRTKTTYDIHIGGSPSGDRLAHLWREKVSLDEIGTALEPIIEQWSRDARSGESFGDFVTRVGL